MPHSITQAPEPHPAPPSEQTGTGLKPWSSRDLGCVPGHGPQFPDSQDPEAGGGAGSQLPEEPAARPDFRTLAPVVLGDAGTLRMVGGILTPCLVSTQTQPRPRYDPHRATDAGSNHRHLLVSTRPPVQSSAPTPPCLTIPSLASTPNSGSPQPTRSWPCLGSQPGLASDSARRPASPRFSLGPHHGSRLSLATAPASPWLSPWRLASLGALPAPPPPLR